MPLHVDIDLKKSPRQKSRRPPLRTVRTLKSIRELKTDWLKKVLSDLIDIEDPSVLTNCGRSEDSLLNGISPVCDCEA